MNYDQALHYLYNKLPLFSRLGAKAYKANLTNTKVLCSSLGEPQEKIKTIHVAGTNGKGSCSHMLAAIFQQNGYKTGLYTSPHLQDFRERIRINGAMVPKDFIIDFVEKTMPLSEKINPSFFEMTFAMALDFFASQKVDVAIIETGLGGRLDSTNVISPLLSIITNIGLDHMDVLGDSLEKIAFEKAGIIKPNRPVVIGEHTKETKIIFQQKAKETDSTIYFASERYKIKSAKYTHQNLDITIVNKKTNQVEDYQLDLNGTYQEKNFLTVLTAVDYLRPLFSLKEEKTKAALVNVKKLTGLHGRWEVVHTDPFIALDVAHNADGISQLVQQIAKLTYHRLHIIFGMVKDKDADKVLGLLPKQAIYYFAKAHSPRALHENILMGKASQYQLKGQSYSKVPTALKAAVSAASKDDAIIICGSVFIVAEVNQVMLKEILRKYLSPINVKG